MEKKTQKIKKIKEKKQNKNKNKTYNKGGTNS